MRTKYSGLEVIGATEVSDVEAIKGFRAKTGADYPILHGLTAETKTAYGVKSYPFFVVLNKDGTIAGSDDAAIAKAAGG
jgi:hypothetical protein